MAITDLIYPIFVLIVLGFSLIMIPRDLFKEYFMYGFLIGGLGDVISVTVFQNMLGLIQFENQGIFNVLGHHALSPIGWTLAIMLFLFFLPQRKPFLIAYVVSWAFMAVGFGYIVHNVGLFYFKSWFYPIPAYFVFLAEMSFAAWLFLKTSTVIDNNQTN